MESEVTNLAQVKAFDSSDYATAAQGSTADNALPKAGGTMTGNIALNGNYLSGDGGDEGVFVDSSGNVGIGATTPSGTLDITSSGSDTPLVINKASQAGVRERLMTAKVSDDATSSFFINNGTSGNGTFAPVFGGYSESTALWPLGFGSFTNSTGDASDSSSWGMVDFLAMRTTDDTDPLNGNLSSIQNRKLFTFRGGPSTSDIKMAILADGNVGIGTTAPDTLLHNAGAYTQESLSSDPADPDAGNSVQWVSDGTGSGDAGDVMMKINVGGTTKVITLIDYSVA
jgi:hypothetical protein